MNASSAETQIAGLIPLPVIENPATSTPINSGTKGASVFIPSLSLDLAPGRLCLDK